MAVTLKNLSGYREGNVSTVSTSKHPTPAWIWHTNLLGACGLPSKLVHQVLECHQCLSVHQACSVAETHFRVG